MAVPRPVLLAILGLALCVTAFVGVRGVGAGDVPRRALTELDVLDIVDDEITDRVDHARQYDTLDQTTAADQLRAEAAVLESYLAS